MRHNSNILIYSLSLDFFKDLVLFNTQEKRSIGFRFGERVGHSTLLPNQQRGKVWLKLLLLLFYYLLYYYIYFILLLLFSTK